MTVKTVQIKSYEPNYEALCIVCGQTPIVNAVDDKYCIVYTTGMCGPCTWGEAAMIDPEEWNL